MSSFENNVRAIFKNHGLENEQLESVVVDLFKDFKTHLMYDREFFESIQTSLQREKNIKREFK